MTSASSSGGPGPSERGEHAPTGVVVGGDVGGTGTRVLVADLAGRVLGRGSAAGGNPTTHGVQAASAAMSQALTAALTQARVDVPVLAAVFGMAGGGALRDPSIGAVYTDVFTRAGVTAAPELTGDARIAFASASPAPDGIILLAGTGAAAAALRDHQEVGVEDGLGWLLGDAGSGFWLGRQAVRRTIEALARGRAQGELGRSVIARLLPDPPADPTIERDELVRAVNAQPPIALSTLAPLVTTAAASGDPVAVDICQGAARELMHSIEAVADLVRPSDPVVLNGGVVRDPASPVGSHLRTLLAARFTGPVLVPRDGSVGAAWLAIRSVLGAADPSLPAVHAELSRS